MNRPIVAAAALLAAALAPLAATAQESETTSTGIQLSGDEPIEIESDSLEVREQEGIAIFTGSVSVVQGETLLKSGRMVVHYAQDGEEGENGGSPATGSSEIERLEVSEKVYVKSEDQVATGDEGTYDMASEVLVLTGEEVVLSEGDNVVVGCKLTVQMDTGQANLEGCGDGESGGRVRMLLSPDSRESE